MKVSLERQADALLGEQGTDHERVPLRDADRVLVHELVEFAGHGPEIEVTQALAHRVCPDFLQRGHDRLDVRAGREESQFDEVHRHRLVVLVHRVHHGVDQHLLVGLRQLGHVAKVDVRDPPVAHREDVPRVWVSVEQPELEQLSQPRYHPHPDKLVQIDPRVLEPLDVRAANAVDPLHYEHFVTADLTLHPRDLDIPVVPEVLPEVLEVPGLLDVVQLLQQFFSKLVHDQLRVAPQPRLGQRVEQLGDPPEDPQVPQDDRLHPRPLHLDGHRLVRLAQHSLVHLPQTGRRDRALGDARKHLPDIATRQLPLQNRKRLRVRERRHIVLQHAQLVHVVLAHDVRSVGQDLARLDERRPQPRQQVAQLGRPPPDQVRVVLGP
mmetsp:Transcript_11303/g.31615  ORF Transcript_11303/g.31615 Transcript_11303/m.31615 type:complete len:380 (-) Transcript_11303:441-1580(-)